MKILFHLGHPAHFHLFKNTILELKKIGHESIIVIKKKDVLEDLLNNSNFDYINILPEGKRIGRLDLIITQFKQISKVYKIAKKYRPELLCGTSVAISIAGKLLKIPSFNFNEDDAEAVPLYAKMAYPWATKIFAPTVCSVDKWSSKKIGYESYHELAYLHPDNFIPLEKIASNYLDLGKPFCLIRFADLNAHHDKGIKGISEDLAHQLISILEPFAQVFITSEKPLTTQFEKYRLKINPLDIHHVMSYALLFIGDSQTMAAEAGVLGIPFIRYGDFVGKISYLKELEEKYKLGFGFKTDEQNQLLLELKNLLNDTKLKSDFQEKRQKMLSDKIDLSKFITKKILDFFQG